ncbi:MAG: phosphatidylglycerol---prolipoprotein diacylglyceryl transferase [Phycisphaerales bacterium]|jgi:prolipoprotein diacylglyceryltransferase|nr:phosphatidylglycerol---prolipoprotein diacylglyceryl transferase [Phycisphaerales bacterium]
MTFPVEFHVLGRTLPAHLVFEILAYTAGFQLYLFLRRRHPRADVPFEQTAWILVGCVFGALIGSKILAWVESPIEYWNARGSAGAWIGGKTIVGGLLGGWIGVEIAKRKLDVKNSTGDAFVFPLILGTAIGRIGCFLTGLADHTHGVPTTLPWAVNFGDGPRHPTQLYEIAFLILLAVALLLRASRPHFNGELFRLFMLGYLTFRFAIEFIKPRYAPWLSLSAIQVACLVGVIACAASLSRRVGDVRRITQEAG